ncbi:hypothetical protein ES703_106467 [subsurface metagenome]
MSNGEISKKKFEIISPKKFEKILNKLKLSEKYIYKIRTEIKKKLKSKPYDVFDPKISKVANQSLIGTYILRVGNYRILYDINFDLGEVILTTIKHRSAAYE